MWKQFKKEIIAGSLVIGILSFALGCVFNDSMTRNKYQTIARIEQGSDKGINGQCPGESFDQGQGRQGHRGDGPGHGRGRRDGQQPSADKRQGGGSENQDQTPADQPDNNDQNKVDDNKNNSDDNENNTDDTEKKQNNIVQDGADNQVNSTEKL